jgi:metallo-beta-lactamase family protein
MMPQPAHSPSGLSVTFWGAAQAVTGSMHLVEAGGHRLLLDCGAVRGPRSHGRPHATAFPFEPDEIEAVVVSHAHIDHCGNLPGLVRRGFTGPLYCTAATRDLVALMLANSARIEEENAFVGEVVGQPGHTEAQPFFTRRDVSQMIRQCVTLSYGETRAIGPGIQLQLLNAGHILGSAIVSLFFTDGSATRRLTFTGDLGRRSPALLRSPAPLPPADLLISESTYGGRALDSPEQAAEALEAVVRDTVARGGKVLIPSFSLGRAQVVVHALERALHDGRLPDVPILVDSSSAADITAVYRNYPELLDDETQDRLQRGEYFLDGPAIRYVRSSEESREWSTRPGPCVIIAPGGMCEGGRIVGHLKQHIDDPRCSIVLVNYQAPHTPGRQLLERKPTVRFHGRKWNKWADVVYLAGFSGHADHDDLLAALTPLAGPTARVRLVHGEPEQAAALARDLRRYGVADVAIPARGETVFVP